jgi:transcriptional regulator with XRE-family HTH domain
MVRIGENGLGVIIKSARKGKGLTQEVLAERIGVGLRHIVSIENEGAFPSFDVLYKLIRELHIPADSIFYPEETVKDPLLDEIICMLHDCDERSKKIIHAAVQAALDSKSRI